MPLPIRLKVKGSNSVDSSGLKPGEFFLLLGNPSGQRKQKASNICIPAFDANSSVSHNPNPFHHSILSPCAANSGIHKAAHIRFIITLMP